MVTNTKKKSAKKRNRRLTAELLETARDMHTSGLMMKAARRRRKGLEAIL
jgi:hypothetical protein